MVLTRNGTSVRRHAVRFKKGTDARRVLEYDEDDWPSKCVTPNNSPPDKVTPSTLNGGILVNKNSYSAQSDAITHTSYTQHSSDGMCTSTDTAIPYDVKERYSFTWLWDSLLFMFVTLVCYSLIITFYSWWGHRLYLGLTALFIMAFSYNIAYFDSSKPGVMPPSPLSPTAYRQTSGHTYHLTYLMIVVNGLTFLVVESYIRGVIIPPV
ncbi:uncharacterized protein [Watersipora subatra]|uniref:uncharacterized protein n=1 Tax=Watersipora subatra TaxID=2589382 RepID=UPI00355B3465